MKREHRMATLYDVAALAGVSPKTVSRVLNESHLVAEGTRQRVLEAIQKLDYHPNAIAASLKRRFSNTVGFVVPYGSDFVFQDLNMMEQLRGVHDALTQEGYNVVVSAPLNKKDALQEAMRLAKRRNVDGIILYPSAGIDRIIAEFIHKGLPYVTLGMGFQNQMHNFVEVDMAEGTYLATRYLVSSGHRHIGLITRPGNFFNYSENDSYFAGYRTALSELGIAFRPEFVREGNFTFESGYREFRYLKEKYPEITAFLCASDPMAYGAIQAMMDMGLQWLKDVEIVAGDNLPLTQRLFPFLSSIANPSYEQGRQAGKMIITLLKGKREIPGIILKAEFVLRRGHFVNVLNPFTR
ncbi:MAG: LacI family DNA-binding transcriptional regulator [Candidatus Caldatribacteriaceae bacterium]